MEKARADSSVILEPKIQVFFSYLEKQIELRCQIKHIVQNWDLSQYFMPMILIKSKTYSEILSIGII